MTENIWWEEQEENQGKVILPPWREIFSKKAMVNSGQRVKPEELDLASGDAACLEEPVLKGGQEWGEGEGGAMEAVLPRTLATSRRNGATAKGEGCREVWGQGTRGGKSFVSCWTGETWAGVSAKHEKTLERKRQLPGQLWDHPDWSLARIALWSDHLCPVSAGPFLRAQLVCSKASLPNCLKSKREDLLESFIVIQSLSI